MKRPLLIVGSLLLALAPLLSPLQLATSAAQALTQSGAAQPHAAWGIVRVRGASASPLLGSGNLTYHNGPVMRTNQTYAIYWVPPGYSIASGYDTITNQYLGDVAAASGQSSNVYATDTEYYDTTGPIAYSSRFAGSIVDTDPLPASGCHDSVTSVCLSDGQIQAEIQHVIQQQGWTSSSTTEFFMLTAKGIGSCFSNNECSFSYYCAYHSNIPGSSVYYANMPYADTAATNCDSGQHPNGNDADGTINVLSHEHNETVTDPLGSAWYDASGYEDGDKCAWIFGPVLGGGSGAEYDQIINGHHYWLQEEWSDHSSACLASDGSGGPTPTPTQPAQATATATPPGQATATSTPVPPTKTPSAGTSVTLSPSSGAPGTVMTINGSGFSGFVTLTWNGSVIVYVTASSNGTFQQGYTVGKTQAPGAYTVAASDSAGHQASAVFTVTGSNPGPTATPTQPAQATATPTPPGQATATSTPVPPTKTPAAGASLTLSPSSGAPGTIVTISGSGFSGLVTLTWNGKPLAYDSSMNGTFQQGYTIGVTQAPGAYTVAASDSAGHQASAIFTVT